MTRLRTLTMAALGGAALLLAAAPAAAHGRSDSHRPDATLATGHGLLLSVPVPGTTTGTTARARFEFIVREVGAGPVRGHTEFQVFTGKNHLGFSSRTETGLVLTLGTCSIAYSGTGSEGRTGGYTFAVTAVDTKMAGCTLTTGDSFAITITPPTGVTAGGYTLAATSLTRGSITIH